MDEHVALKFARRLLAKNELDPLLAEGIVELIEKAEYSAFFGISSLAEVNIGATLPNGQKLTGIIDRLAIHGDQISILDYKTDWKVPDVLTVDHPYVLQLAGYALALRQAYKEKTVKAAILWTNGPRLDWISNDMLHNATSRIAAIT